MGTGTPRCAGGREWREAGGPVYLDQSGAELEQRTGQARGAAASSRGRVGVVTVLGSRERQCRGRRGIVHCGGEELEISCAVPDGMTTSSCTTGLLSVSVADGTGPGRGRCGGRCVCGSDS